MCAGLFGLLGLFVDAIPSLLTMGPDILATVWFASGGIAWAVRMKRTPCERSHVVELYQNRLLNQGCSKGRVASDVPWCGILRGKVAKGELWWPWWGPVWPKPLQPICERAYALEAVQFVGLGLSIGLLVLGFLMLKRKGERLNFLGS